MKRLFLLSLMALAPIAASAQTTTQAHETTPQVSVEPQAKALLDHAITAYRNAKEIRLQVVRTENGKPTRTFQNSFQFQKPNLFRAQRKEGATSFLVVSDGGSLYFVAHGTYQKAPASTESVALFAGVGGVSALCVNALMNGENPLSLQEKIFTGSPDLFRNFRSTTVELAPRKFGDSLLRGVQFQMSAEGHGHGKTERISKQRTLWFDGASFLLKRVEDRDLTPEKTSYPLIEEITEQQLNPTFAPDAFKFDPTGLKPFSVPQLSSRPR